MPAATHPSPDELAAFAAGLSDDAAIEAHLAECPDCAAALVAAPPDTFQELLRSAETSVPDQFDTPSLSLTHPRLPPDRGDIPADLVGHPRYRLERVIGAGGMGTVWLAEHLVLNRPVAVKVIRAELLARPGAAERFRQEARAAARLSHPNIVTVHDADAAGCTHFLVMEHVAGRTLAQVRKAGPVPHAVVCGWVRDAARGLTHAHAAGLVHRDVKPQNLMLAADGTVKVLDFGLAVAAHAGGGPTGANMIVGTADYIAPEQATDPHAADARSDIYSLGCTLYHLLAGRVPFPADGAQKKLDAHRTQEPGPLADTPPALAAVVAKMMAKRPEDRYQTAAEVVAALEPFTMPPRRSRRLAVAAALGVLVAAIALVVAQVVIVRDKDGKEVARVIVPDGGSVTISSGGTATEPATAEPYRLLPISVRSKNWKPLLSADGRRIAVPDGTGIDSLGAIMVYDTATGEKVYELVAGKDRAFTDFEFSADGSRILAGIGQRGVYGLWVADVGAKRHAVVPLASPLPGWPCQFSLAANGARTAVYLDAGKPETRGVWVVDLESGALLLKPGGDRPQWESAALTADGTRAVLVQKFADAAGKPTRGSVVVRELNEVGRATSAECPRNLGFPWRDGDGRMYTWRVDPNGGTVFVRIDPETARAEDVLPVSPITARFPGYRGETGPWAVTHDPDRQQVRVHDLRGRRTAFATGPISNHVASTISADGRTLAVFAGSQVRLYRVPEPTK